MKYKAVLFDLDGTLLNTLEDLATSMNLVLERNGYPTHTLEEYKYFIGDGVDKLVRRALPPDVPEAETNKFISVMREEYRKHYNEKTRTYKGIPEMLESLVARGLKLAILSNKPHDLTQEVVSRILPHWRFNQVLGAKPQIPKKPDPTGALEIAVDLNILPEEVLYLGDTDTDMKTANSAGMYPVGALWGFRTADELSAAGAKALVENPMDLMRLL